MNFPEAYLGLYLGPQTSRVEIFAEAPLQIFDFLPVFS